MHKSLACFLVTGAGLLTPMTILNAQAPEPGRESGPVAVQDVTSSREPVAVGQGNRPAAVSQPMRRSLSINSSYFKKFYTNTQMADVGLETMQGYSFFSHKLEGLLPQNKMARVALRSATLFGNWHVSVAFGVAYHELGHATRVGAYGRNYKFGGTLTDATVEENGFFQHYGRLLLSGGLLSKTASVHTYDAKFEPAERKNLTGTDLARYLAKQELIIHAAGVNNQMAFAERLADEAYEGDGHWTFALAYFRDRSWSIAYGRRVPSYDMDRVFGSYDQLGILASKSQVNTAHLLAALLVSGSTYRYSRGLYHYLRDGSHSPIGAYEFHNVRVPETSVYLTSRGISYKVKSGYRFKDGLLLNAGLEYVAHGDHSGELTLGLAKKVESLRSAKLRGNVIVGSGIDAEINASLPLNNRSSVGMGLGHYSSKTLYGERNVPSLEHGPSSTMLWVKMSLNY